MRPHDSLVLLTRYYLRVSASCPELSAQDVEVNVDFRELNRRIKKDKFPLPKIQNILDAIGCSGRLSSFDVEDAFFNVMLSVSGRELTGFSTHEAHYEFKCMPQGAGPAAEAFANVIHSTLSELLPAPILFYQDDVFNYAESFVDHIENQERVYEKLRLRNMVLKPSKSHYNYRQMKVLGHMMTEEGRYPDPELVRAINDLGVPIDQPGAGV